jgi:DNA polymerase III subunit epsilon
MRQIALDTETTGFSPKHGDRMVEIGCVELIDMKKTGKTFHHYINPERDIPARVTAIHGITNEKVANAPIFSGIVDSFINFVGDSQIIIHNAPFDMRFLDAELSSIGKTKLNLNRVIDTLPIAKKLYPGSSANLNALCSRFAIDTSTRSLHGALLDAELLADVYAHLMMATSSQRI